MCARLLTKYKLATVGAVINGVLTGCCLFFFPHNFVYVRLVIQIKSF